MAIQNNNFLGSRQLLAGLVAGALAAQVMSSSAQILTLADQNSVAQVSVNTQAGMLNWTVDGVNQLAQQWFWYRVGAAGPEQAINAISAAVTSQPDAKTLYTTYTSAGAYSVQVRYGLNGGVAGSGTADISEQIQINNLTGAALDFHFFQYCDFDLAGTPGGDSTLLRFGPNAWFVADQSKGATALEEQVNTPAANHGEAGFFNTTLARLNDGVATTLNDNASAGPGNTAYALEWDVNIASGGTFLISKDKRITLTTVPEPSALALVSCSLVAWSLRKRSQKK